MVTPVVVTSSDSRDQELLPQWIVYFIVVILLRIRSHFGDLNGEYENESNITTSVGWHQRVNGHDIQKSGLGFSIDLESMYCSRDTFFCI